MSFEAHVDSRIVDALRGVPRDIAADVYVVSLLVYDEEDEPSAPTVTVGFNTESEVASTRSEASDEDEARWNFAFWLQNELAVVGDSDRDPKGASLRAEWVGMDQDDVTERFVELLVAVTRGLHERGVIDEVFGRSVPVLIHELEYYDEIAEQNLRANPDRIAEPFARWIAEM